MPSPRRLSSWGSARHARCEAPLAGSGQTVLEGLVPWGVTVRIFEERGGRIHSLFPLVPPLYFLVATGSLFAAGFFAALSWQLSRRSRDPGISLPAVAFAVAWGAFSFMALNDALRITLGVWALPTVEVYFTLARLKIFAAAIAIWGLGLYVVYLWSGTVRGWNLGLSLVAASHAFLFLYLMERRSPAGVELGPWAPGLTFANPPALGESMTLLVFAYFFFPPVALTLLYLFVVFRLKDRTQRFRVTMVAVAVLLFHLTNAIQSRPETPRDSPVWVVIAIVNVLVGIVAYTAYQPPAWMRRLFRIEGLATRGPANGRAKVFDSGFQAPARR
jgi:hypothetical protein